MLAGEPMSRFQPASRKTNKGFTLIEILVTTAILGMIAVAILATFASGLNVYNRVKTYGGIQADVLLSLEKMERDLRNVFSLSGIDFSGDTERVSFAGLIKTVDAEGNRNVSLGKISYYLDSETGTLVKEEQDYPRAVSGVATEDGIFKVLAFIKNIDFSYYYFNVDTQRYDWKGSWSLGEGLPKGIKIEVTFRDGSKDTTLVRTVFIPVAS